MLDTYATRYNLLASTNGLSKVTDQHNLQLIYSNCANFLNKLYFVHLKSTMNTLHSRFSSLSSKLSFGKLQSSRFKHKEIKSDLQEAKESDY